MQELSERVFRNQVFRERFPVLVEFYAKWCGTCSMMEDVFETVAEKFDGKISAGRVDIEKNPYLAEKYRIRTIPTYLLFEQEKVIVRMSGVMEMEEMIERVINALQNKGYE